MGLPAIVGSWRGALPKTARGRSSVAQNGVNAFFQFVGLLCIPCTHCDFLDVVRCCKSAEVEDKTLPILPAGLGQVRVTFSASRRGVRVAGETGRGSEIVRSNQGW